MSVRVDFALIHQAAFVVVKKLDRILDRDHVFFALAVDLVEHRCQSGRLARSCWSSDQHQAARLVAQTFHYNGEPKRIEPFDFPRNCPEHCSYGASLLKKVAAEARQIFQSEREI